MNIHEHQAKQILKKYGAVVPNGVFALNVSELIEKAKTLKTEKYVLKAQIHAGGRGKAGGIKILDSLDELINSKCNLDLVWKGHADEEIRVSKYNYGGLFLRMPWKRNIGAETINSNSDKNQIGEGKSANWVDLGMEISGLDKMGRIVIYEHPSNDGFPNLWRIDGQFGIGPASARRGNWTINEGENKIFKHRLVVYSGEHDKPLVNQKWKEWSQ